MAHRYSLTELGVLLAEAEQNVPTKSVWRHYRDNSGKKPYTIVGHAIEEKTSQIVVLYQADEQITFSRPIDEFCEYVRGGTQKRFQKIS